MRVLDESVVVKSRAKLLRELEAGAVFIYPTDTIYGFGCDATNSVAVKRIRELKLRESKPFSVIAPSIGWIRENCVLSDKAESWLLKLPGPYTLVLPLKKSSVVCVETNMGLKSIGVRLPNHWISDFVASFGKPVITTSVNVAGAPPCSSLSDFKKFSVDFIIYEGDKAGKPSTVVDLTVDEVIKAR